MMNALMFHVKISFKKITKRSPNRFESSTEQRKKYKNVRCPIIRNLKIYNQVFSASTSEILTSSTQYIIELLSISIKRGK